MLRWIYDVKRHDNIRNEKIRDRNGAALTVEKLRERLLRLFAHVFALMKTHLIR